MVRQGTATATASETNITTSQAVQTYLALSTLKGGVIADGKKMSENEQLLRMVKLSATMSRVSPHDPVRAPPFGIKVGSLDVIRCIVGKPFSKPIECDGRHQLQRTPYLHRNRCPWHHGRWVLTSGADADGAREIRLIVRYPTSTWKSGPQ